MESPWASSVPWAREMVSPKLRWFQSTSESSHGSRQGGSCWSKLRVASNASLLEERYWASSCSSGGGRMKAAGGKDSSWAACPRWQGWRSCGRGRSKKSSVTLWQGSSSSRIVLTAAWALVAASCQVESTAMMLPHFSTLFLGKETESPGWLLTSTSLTPSQGTARFCSFERPWTAFTLPGMEIQARSAQ